MIRPDYIYPKLILFISLMITITGCGGQVEVGYSPPVIIPIRIGVDPINGEVKIGISSRQFTTPIGKFDLELESNYDFEYTLISLTGDDTVKDMRLLIVRVDDEMTVFELTEGEEFNIEIEDEESGYKKVGLTRKDDGDIILELESVNSLQTIEQPNFNSVEQDELILFSSIRVNDADIFLMNVDGTRQIKLTHIDDPPTVKDLRIGNPAWSLDGESIAFTSNHEGNFEIYTIKVDGTYEFNFSQLPTSDEMNPAWSPDGKHIAFSSNIEDNRDIYVIDRNRSDFIRLTENSNVDDYPAWSPDGSQIVFVSDRDGNEEIYVMDSDGANQLRLTNNSANDNYPAWSPDGSQIAFTSDRDGNEEIYVMDSDGRNQVNVTNHIETDSHPSWSPDGRKIVFESTRTLRFEIWMLDVDGNNPIQVTDNWKSASFDPAWSP